MKKIKIYSGKTESEKDVLKLSRAVLRWSTMPPGKQDFRYLAEVIVPMADKFNKKHK